MTVEALPAVNGLVSVTLSANLAESARAFDFTAGRRKAASRRPSRRGPVTSCSRKAGIRFSRRVQTTEFSWPHTLAMTLPLSADTDPAAAKRARDAFARILRHAFPGCYGYTSREYKRDGRPHYHVILTTPTHTHLEALHLREWLAAKWQAIAPDGGALYCEPVFSPAGYAEYVTKFDTQRRVPDRWAGSSVGRFWGVIGKPPQTRGRKVSVPESAQGDVRRAVAGLVAAQGGERSQPFAHAVAQSSGKISVWLSKRQAAELLNPLIVKFPTRKRPGPQGAASPRDSMPRPHQRDLAPRHDHATTQRPPNWPRYRKRCTATIDTAPDLQTHCDFLL